MKTIIYFVENHSTNWPLIWSDCSPYICILLFVNLFVVIWLAKNYKYSIKNEYLLRTTVKLSSLQVIIDELTAKNKSLEEKLNQSVRKRDEKGHFLMVTGNGHGKKDWNIATIDELKNEAKRRYKKGDNIICLLDKSAYTLMNKDFKTSFGNEIWGRSKSYAIQLFSNGIWAKKVK